MPNWKIKTEKHRQRNLAICREYRNGAKYQELAKKYNLTYGTIVHIVGSKRL